MSIELSAQVKEDRLKFDKVQCYLNKGVNLSAACEGSGLSTEEYGEIQRRRADNVFMLVDCLQRLDFEELYRTVEKKETEGQTAWEGATREKLADWINGFRARPISPYWAEVYLEKALYGKLLQFKGVILRELLRHPETVTSEEWLTLEGRRELERIAKANRKSFLQHMWNAIVDEWIRSPESCVLLVEGWRVGVSAYVAIIDYEYVRRSGGPKPPSKESVIAEVFRTIVKYGYPDSANGQENFRRNYFKVRKTMQKDTAQ
jgi:hypothetical protein